MTHHASIDKAHPISAGRRNILIVEDNRLLRESLAAVLSSEGEFEVDQTDDGVKALEIISKQPPDLVILDLSMPRMDGLSVLREIRKEHPEVRVLVLTVHESQQYVSECIKEGADGYCVKESSLDELEMAVRSALEGQFYISPAIAGKIIRGQLTGTVERDEKGLTARERQVLKLIAEGHQNKQIGQLLGISTKTVEKHRAGLKVKLGRGGTASLTAYAYESGLIGSSKP
jgi:DNA-binding NarL/FixJ family response regulator